MWILAAKLPNSDLNFGVDFWGDFFLLFFSKAKGPKKSTKKSPAKFTRDFVRKNSPRISAEAFSRLFVPLCLWCSNYRHNTDTEFDGESINFATQIQIQILTLWELIPYLSGLDPLRFLRVALHIEISTRCVFCVAGRIFIGFLSLPNLVLN